MLEIIVPALFGLILGSFANVLILREETGESIDGRSHCPSCKRTLEWYELFPVLSFILLRGKCRTCRARISWQYPLVEILVALGVAIVWLAPISLVQKVLGIPSIFILICIAVYDFRTTYIPDRWAYVFAACALAYAFASPLTPGMWYLVLLSGPVIALPLFLLWLFSAGTWMGLGDAKIALGFGWLLGMGGGFLALGLAFVLGAIVGLALIGITRLGNREDGLTMKSEVPFGPFLILALCIVWFSDLYGLGLPGVLGDFLSLN